MIFNHLRHILTLFQNLNNANTTVPTDVQGSNQPSVFVLNFGIPGWNGDLSQTNDYCQAVYTIDGRANLSPAAQGAGYWFLIDGLDPANATTTCTNIDPAFSTDIVADFASFTWQIYLGGPVDPSIATYISPDSYGGFIESDLFSPGIPIGAVSYETVGGVLSLDASGNPIVIPATAVPNAGGMVRNYAVAEIPWIFNF